MDKHHILLIIHLISATVWVGGHLVLLLGFLPKALKHKNFDFISRFEKTYEPIGMPSLLLLVITGILMHHYLRGFPLPQEWRRWYHSKLLGYSLLFALPSVPKQECFQSLLRGKSKSSPKWRYIFYVLP